MNEKDESCDVNSCEQGSSLSTRAPVTQAKLKSHVFVCTGKSCSQNASQETLEAFWKSLQERNLLYGKRGSLEGSVIVSTSASVGLCAVGPAVMIYPDGIWYYGVQAKDAEEIVEEHLINKRPVQRLLAYEMKRS